MKIDTRGWVSVAELIVYLPLLAAAIVTCLRHGFKKSGGWIYTLILCVVRIVGAVIQLLTYHDASTGLITAYFIIDSIGLSPLLLATLGMLSRLYDWINARTTSMMGVKQFRLIQLLITLGLILSIAGGASAGTDSDGKVQIATTSKAGVLLLLAGYIAIVFVWVMSLSKLSAVPSKERRVSLAVMIAIPLIAVRMVYSTLSIFLHNKYFGLTTGSITVRICMALIEEWIVVFIYILLGWFVDKIHPDETGPIASREWKGRKDRRQNRGQHQNNEFSPQTQQTTAYAPAHTRDIESHNVGNYSGGI